MPIQAVSAISGIGGGLVQLFHRAEDAAKSVIEALVRLFRNIIDWIYALLYRFWEMLMDDPLKFTMFMANICVFMA